MKKYSKHLMILLMIAVGLSWNNMYAKQDDISSNLALSYLQASQFEKAQETAETVLKTQILDSLSNVILAITTYKKAMHDLFYNLLASVESNNGINHSFIRWALMEAEKQMELIESHLNNASDDASFGMDLCLANWEVDWNKNGRIDERDRMVFQIEMDENGEYLPENDPRRKPTFHFDYGDVYWARAMIAFQRAFINILLSYSYQEVTEENLDRMLMEPEGSILTLKMENPNLVHKAKQLILNGLSYADKARIEYLKETDDFNEWVPNPRQKNHPLPLPVNNQLYQTWEGVIEDIRNLVAGKEGISVEEAAQLGEMGWTNPPKGYINIGRLLDEPADIVINMNNVLLFSMSRTGSNSEAILKDIFGDKYTDNMKASPLLKRLSRMKSEMERGEESLERKLRYLLWLN